MNGINLYLSLYSPSASPLSPSFFSTSNKGIRASSLAMALPESRSNECFGVLEYYLEMQSAWLQRNQQILHQQTHDFSEIKQTMSHIS